MIKGIGTDLCSISRIRRILDREGPDGPFIRRVFTPAERQEASGRHDAAAFYAARFAVKEAVFKAVSPAAGRNFDLRLVESLHHPDGSPYVSITDDLRPLLRDADVSVIHLSVTTEGDFAQAFAIAENTSE